MTKTYDTRPAAETAVLVAVSPSFQTQETTQSYLNELAFLATTLGIETLHTFTQKLDKPHPQTFVGKGKLEEIVQYVKENEVDMIIFDDDLSPSQVRNMERAFNGVIIDKAKHKILDRSLLILDIFAKRAQTIQAKTQVELAQYQYMYPRLTRMWTHLSKQKGGIGMRGPGETELETDRRIVKDKIALLKTKLSKIDSQNTTRRKAREDSVRVALVGYTNVGKSTLMRLLAKTDVFAENKLFATVDSTVRKVVLDNIPFLLTDTVGFIRKLPTTLIESFKSTLDEIREADILIHVVDISSSHYEEHIQVVRETLADIQSADKPTLMVYNKIDLLRQELPEETTFSPQENALYISATSQENIQALREALMELVRHKYQAIYPNYL
jgi:GTP-binding protein HflX